jgi:hypothetical protein
MAERYQLQVWGRNQAGDDVHLDTITGYTSAEDAAADADAILAGDYPDLPEGHHFDSIEILTWRGVWVETRRP